MLLSNTNTRQGAALGQQHLKSHIISRPPQLYHPLYGGSITTQNPSRAHINNTGTSPPCGHQFRNNINNNHNNHNNYLSQVHPPNQHIDNFNYGLQQFCYFNANLRQAFNYQYHPALAYHPPTLAYHPPSPTRTRLPTKQPLTRAQVAAGVVVFLPPQQFLAASLPRCITKGCLGNHHLEEAAFNHPILILEILDPDPFPDGEAASLKDLHALCCIVTSSAHSSKLNDGVPISTVPSPGESSASTCRFEDILYVEQGNTFKKPSYLEITHVFRLPLSILRLFGDQPFATRLTGRSYKTLMEKINRPS